MKYRVHLLAHIYLFMMMFLSSSKVVNVLALRKLPTSSFLRRTSIRNAWTSPARPYSIATSSSASDPSSVKLLFRSYLRPMSQKSTKHKQNENDNSHLMPELFNYVSFKNFTKAKEIFDLILATPSGISRHQRKNVLTSMLSLCERGDQLDFALQLRHDLESAGFVPSESDIYHLINCASDMGDISLAYQYLQEIIDAKFQVRHRDIFPIVKALAATSSVNDSHKALDECFSFRRYGLYPRPQELELIIASGVRTGAIKNLTFRDKLSNCISLINDTYCAIDQVSALRLHQAVHEGTLATEKEESISYLTEMYRRGILVEKLSDITGQVR